MQRGDGTLNGLKIRSTRVDASRAAMLSTKHTKGTNFPLVGGRFCWNLGLALHEFPASHNLFAARGQGAKLLGDDRLLGNGGLDQLSGENRDFLAAVTTTPEQMADLQARLAKEYGPGLEIQYIINPALLGGLRIQVGSDLYDGSVKNRLDQLEQSF